MQLKTKELKNGYLKVVKYEKQRGIRTKSVALFKEGKIMVLLEFMKSKDKKDFMLRLQCTENNILAWIPESAIERGGFRGVKRSYLFKTSKEVREFVRNEINAEMRRSRRIKAKMSFLDLLT